MKYSSVRESPSYNTKIKYTGCQILPTAKIFRLTLVGAVQKKEAIMNELKCYSAYRDSQV